MSLIQELRTRNVLKVGIVYAVVSWILLQIIELLSGLLSWPGWTPQLLLVILVVGFVPAMVMAWTFELTPEGVKLDKDVVRPAPVRPRRGRKLNYTIIGALALGVAFQIWEAEYEQKQAEVAALAAAESGEPGAVPDRAGETSDSDARMDPNAIAVLPFENRSPDPTDVYFTDGVHDDLLVQLSKIGAFRVISRASVVEYRDSARNLGDIARELGVANIMQGSVQKMGDRVRINVRLIDARTEEHLWADSYDRRLTTSDLFDIQSGIAKAIAESLRATLSESDLAGMNEVPTDDVEAYEAYLEARHLGREATRAGNQQALAAYQRALDLDPSFKLGWIGLAHTHITRFWSYGGDPRDAERARQAIDRARDIDPNFPELYVAEGFYWYWAHLDYERALYNLERAIARMPGNSEAHMWHGWVSRRSGLWDQGLESMRRSLRLDPRVSYNWAELGGTYLFLHRFGEARAALARALEVNAENVWGKSVLANLHLMEGGDVDAALRWTAGAETTDDAGFFEQYMEARIYARRFEEVLDAARQMPAALETQRTLIMLREMWAARALFFMGRAEAAQDAAKAALFRLQRLAEQLGEDYRIDLARAMLSPVLGESAQDLEARIRKSQATRPDDAIQAFQARLRYARIYGMAGQAERAAELLETLLVPPSGATGRTVALDPAFDTVRNTPEFTALMERADEPARRMP